MSTLMFWNKQNANANQNNEAKNGKKNWLHAPDALVNGHIAYLVKFLGSTPVDQAKGIETVKDAIRRLQFTQAIKKAESGNNVKTKKVEITISVDGVAVQEPRVQKILHQFPLHNISYCADEKGVKKFFSFIAKTNKPVPNDDRTNGSSEDKHECFVFVSSKLASDITLTIGQAFELAYRRYVNDSSKGTDILKLQSEHKNLENTVSAYRQRLKDLVDLLPKNDMDRLLLKYGVRDILEVPVIENITNNHVASINGKKTPDLGIDVSTPNNDDQLLIETSPKQQHYPIVPPRNLQNQINSTLDALKPSVGTKLEGLLLNSDSDSDFDPRAEEFETSNGNKISNDLFGFEPPKTLGQQLFAANNNQNYNSNNNNHINHHNNNLVNSFSNNNNMNGSSPTSPPPLLAPPPKASVPRRSAAQNNNNINQDLFGSTPFSVIQPSPFDAGVDAFNTSYSTLNENNTVYSELKNSFNESGISMNGSNSSNSSSSNSIIGPNEYVPPKDKYHELSAVINQNFNKFDGLIKYDSTANGTSISFMDQNEKYTENSSGQEFPIKSNPFSTVGNGTTSDKTIELTSRIKVSPFANRDNNINYDVLRSSPSLDDNNGNVVEKKKKHIRHDLFKDAAAAAFGEFGGNGGSGKTKYEFSNKMSESLGTSVAMSNGFGNFVDLKQQQNFNKPLCPVDFSLESLDPLRK